MRSSRFRVGPKYNDQCPYKRKEREIRDTERQRESSVKTELETGLTDASTSQGMNAVDCQQPPGAKREAWKGNSP